MSLNLHHSLSRRELLSHYNPIQIFGHRLSVAENLYQRDLSAHYGCVNALEFSNGGQYLASGGDDRRVLLWNVDQALVDMGEPSVMSGEHASNIFCLGFDKNNEYIFSGGNDDLVIQHDMATGKTLNVFSHDGPVYGLSVDKTTTNLFTVATEDGDILLYDLRVDKTDPKVIAKFRSPFNAVEFHPLNGNFLATANAKRGAMLWDIRHHAQALCQYNYISESPSCMSVRFNCNGSFLLTLHRRLPPILYNPSSSEPLCTFYHHEYFNSCTMKSCTFAGPEDELIVSGSDNFNMFIWRLNGVDMKEKDQWIDSSPIILTGHRSIVNQVRYNRQRCLLASSGVEKIIKFWSPFEQQGWQGSLLKKAKTPHCTRTLYRNATEHVSQDFSTRNVEEDSVMLAFFDTLVQRELESWHTENGAGAGGNPAGGGGGESNTTATSATTTESESSVPSVHTLDTPNVSELSWQKYPNRIFYLIAKKRRPLLHLAVKCASSTGCLPHRVGGRSPLTSSSVDHMLAAQLDENVHTETQTRVKDWLKDTQRVLGDDETPTTSAEAAARERWRVAAVDSNSSEQEQDTTTTTSTSTITAKTQLTTAAAAVATTTTTATNLHHHMIGPLHTLFAHRKRKLINGFCGNERHRKLQKSSDDDQNNDDDNDNEEEDVDGDDDDDSLSESNEANGTESNPDIDNDDTTSGSSYLDDDEDDEDEEEEEEEENVELETNNNQVTTNNNSKSSSNVAKTSSDLSAATSGITGTATVTNPNI